MMRRTHVAAVLFAAIAVILLMIFCAPLIVESGTLRGLDGSIALVDHREIWRGMDFFTGSIYMFGDLICHQMESRTLLLNGNEMPICLRDLSILFGFAIGSLMCVFTGDDKVRTKRIWYMALILVVIGLGEWAFEYTTGFDSPLARAATGFLAGIGLALLVQKFIQKMFDDVLEIKTD